MGGSSSREGREPLLQSRYLSPDDRLKLRMVPRSGTPSDPDEADYDPTADKYDFLIVFKNPVDKGVGGAVGGASALGGGDQERITFQEAYDCWFQAIPGEQDKKEAGCKQLEKAWMHKFRVDKVEMQDEILCVGARALSLSARARARVRARALCGSAGRGVGRERDAPSRAG